MAAITVNLCYLAFQLLFARSSMVAAALAHIAIICHGVCHGAGRSGHTCNEICVGSSHAQPLYRSLHHSLYCSIHQYDVHIALHDAVVITIPAVTTSSTGNHP